MEEGRIQGARQDRMHARGHEGKEYQQPHLARFALREASFTSCLVAFPEWFCVYLLACKWASQRKGIMIDQSVGEGGGASELG